VSTGMRDHVIVMVPVKLGSSETKSAFSTIRRGLSTSTNLTSTTSVFSPDLALGCFVVIGQCQPISAAGSGVKPREPAGHASRRQPDSPGLFVNERSKHLFARRVHRRLADVRMAHLGSVGKGLRLRLQAPATAALRARGNCTLMPRHFLDFREFSALYDARQEPEVALKRELCHLARQCRANGVRRQGSPLFNHA
jgi:hypothetical protein